MEILIIIYLLRKEDFFTRIGFKEEKFVIYNLTEPQFCAKSSFNDKWIAIKIYANLWLAYRALNNWAQLLNIQRFRA